MYLVSADLKMRAFCFQTTSKPYLRSSEIFVLYNATIGQYRDLNLSEKKAGFQTGISSSVEKFEQMLSADFQGFQEYVDFLLLVFGVAYCIEPAFGRNGVVDAQAANRGGGKGEVYYRTVVAYG